MNPVVVERNGYLLRVLRVSAIQTVSDAQQGGERFYAALVVTGKGRESLVFGGG